MPPLAGHSRQMKRLPPPTPPKTRTGSTAGAHVQTAKPQRDRQPPAGGSTPDRLLPWTTSKRLRTTVRSRSLLSAIAEARTSLSVTPGIRPQQHASTTVVQTPPIRRMRKRAGPHERTTRRGPDAWIGEAEALAPLLLSVDHQHSEGRSCSPSPESRRTSSSAPGRPTGSSSDSAQHLAWARPQRRARAVGADYSRVTSRRSRRRRSRCAMVKRPGWVIVSDMTMAGSSGAATPRAGPVWPV
jgi:hypothetical protein